MAAASMKCRVCGKVYEGCRTAAKVDGVFRWKDVACSPECGAIYLERIRRSRANTTVVDVSDSEKQKAFALFEEEYEEDTCEEALYDEFDDSDEEDFLD